MASNGVWLGGSDDWKVLLTQSEEVDDTECIKFVEFQTSKAFWSCHWFWFKNVKNSYIWYI